MITQSTPEQIRLANALVWDALRGLGRGSVVVEFNGQTFEVVGNPWQPATSDRPVIPEMRLIANGVRMRHPAYYILPMDSRQLALAGTIQRNGASVGHLRDLSLHVITRERTR